MTTLERARAFVGDMTSGDLRLIESWVEKMAEFADKETADLKAKLDAVSIDVLAAQFIAHRAVGNQEQDLSNGKLAGYCLVCQTPWPCKYSATAIIDGTEGVGGEG